MRIVLKFAFRHLLPNQNDVLKQFTVLVWGRVERIVLKTTLSRNGCFERKRQFFLSPKALRAINL